MTAKSWPLLPSRNCPPKFDDPSKCGFDIRRIFSVPAPRRRESAEHRHRHRGGKRRGDKQDHQERRSGVTPATGVFPPGRLPIVSTGRSRMKAATVPTTSATCSREREPPADSRTGTRQSRRRLLQKAAAHRDARCARTSVRRIHGAVRASHRPASFAASGHSHAAPRTPLASPCFAGTSRVVGASIGS